MAERTKARRWKRRVPVFGYRGFESLPFRHGKALKVLAIDYGSKRVGLAVGDTELKVATPKGVLKNTHDLLDRLRDIVIKSEVGLVVVGLPLTPSGKEGLRAMEVKRFVSELKKALAGVEVVLWDERYTTYEARQRMGRKGKDLDAISALIILEEYLGLP